MPRKPRNVPATPKMSKRDQRRQASFYDVVLEDRDLARHLKTIADGEVVAANVRKAAREAKKIIDAGYREAINSERDGHSGYIQCGGFRFRADVIEKPEETVEAKPATIKPSSRRWAPLDVHRADLFSQVAAAANAAPASE